MAAKKKKAPKKVGSKIRVCRKVKGKKKKVCYLRKAHNKKSSSRKPAKRAKRTAKRRSSLPAPYKPFPKHLAAHDLFGSHPRRRKSRKSKKSCGCK